MANKLQKLASVAAGVVGAGLISLLGPVPAQACWTGDAPVPSTQEEQRGLTVEQYLLEDAAFDIYKSIIDKAARLAEQTRDDLEDRREVYGRTSLEEVYKAGGYAFENLQRQEWDFKITPADLFPFDKEEYFAKLRAEFAETEIPALRAL